MTDDDTGGGAGQPSDEPARAEPDGGTGPGQPSDPEVPPSTGSAPRGEVRAREWPCDRPAHLELFLEMGRIEVALAEDAEAVSVELRTDPASSGWAKGMSGLLDWLTMWGGAASSFRIGGHEISFGQDFPFSPFDLTELIGRDLPDEARHATEIDWTESARRLVVRSTNRMPLRLVPLMVTVRAPAGSRLTARTGTGTLTVTGRSGHSTVHTGSGDVELDNVDGDLRLTIGSGAATVRSVSGHSQAKARSGSVQLDTLGGPATLKADSGSIRLGVVRANVQARTGSGELTVADAERGALTLDTGSGDLTVGVHAGVRAELDLRSGSGRARSALELNQTGPDEPTTLSVQGRTGSGDVLVTRAPSAPWATG